MTDFAELDVFVDGACRNNGQQNPQGGCGVYWGEYHPLNTSEYLIGDKQTNNRAELTDSTYAKKGITKWILQWKTNGWKTNKKIDVLNKDLWQLIDQLSNQVTVNWRWVEGHADITVNIIADELAKTGISSECCYWQRVQNDIDVVEIKTVSKSRKSGALQTNESRKSDITPAKDFNCGGCAKLVIGDGIQCDDCKTLIHIYVPSYLLTSFTCMKCLTGNIRAKAVQILTRISPLNMID